MLLMLFSFSFWWFRPSGVNFFGFRIGWPHGQCKTDDFPPQSGAEV
jgi:hypothetical protein